MIRDNRVSVSTDLRRNSRLEDVRRIQRTRYALLPFTFGSDKYDVRIEHTVTDAYNVDGVKMSNPERWSEWIDARITTGNQQYHPDEWYEAHWLKGPRGWEEVRLKKRDARGSMRAVNYDAKPKIKELMGAVFEYITSPEGDAEITRQAIQHVEVEMESTVEHYNLLFGFYKTLNGITGDDMAHEAGTQAADHPDGSALRKELLSEIHRLTADD
jgi:hypothetical protein